MMAVNKVTSPQNSKSSSGVSVHILGGVVQICASPMTCFVEKLAMGFASFRFSFSFLYKSCFQARPLNSSI